MKKLTVISGIFLIVLNTIGYLIFTKFELFNYILVNFSILSTFSMIYILSNKKNANVYRIALSFVYSFLGLVKVFISFFSKPTVADNFLVMWILGIMFIEIILLFLVGYMNKHVKN